MDLGRYVHVYNSSATLYENYNGLDAGYRLVKTNYIKQVQLIYLHSHCVFLDIGVFIFLWFFFWCGESLSLVYIVQ